MLQYKSSLVAVLRILLVLGNIVAYCSAFLPTKNPSSRKAPTFSHPSGGRIFTSRDVSKSQQDRTLILLQAQTQHDASTLVSSYQNSQVEGAVLCQGGSDPKRPQKVNQDAFFHSTISSTTNNGDPGNESGNADAKIKFTCLGVLDGHGLKGHIVSRYMAERLPLYFREALQDLLEIKLGTDPSIVSCDIPSVADLNLAELEEQLHTLGGLDDSELRNTSTNNRPVVHQAMIQAFHATHRAAMLDTEIPAGRNGATCVMVVLDHDNKCLHVGHVGDSRVLRVNSDGTFTPLSVETTIKVETEKKRIELGEGSIRGNNVFYGPVGIAMTRSLGNAVMLRAGVVPTPMVEQFDSLINNDNNNSYLVLATDGIWDVLSNQVVSEILMANKQQEGFVDISEACQDIYQAARKKWIGDLPIDDEKMVDDITCMVVCMLR